MAVRTRRLPRFFASLVAFAALLLTGCKIDGTVEFQADGRVLIDLTVEDSDGELTKINQRCEALRVMVLGQVKFIRNPKVEDITPPGGRTTCRVTSKEPFVGGFGFKENKDTYSFVFPNNHTDEDYSEFKTRIIITMPGKILNATKGKVNGNKVIINSLDFANTGISITAQKGQGASSGKSAGPSAGGVWGVVVFGFWWVSCVGVGRRRCGCCGRCCGCRVCGRAQEAH